MREEDSELAVTSLQDHSGPSANRLGPHRGHAWRGHTLNAFRARLSTAGAHVNHWRHSPTAGAKVPSGGQAAGGTPERPLKLAYVVSRFPSLSETLVLNEIVTMASLGVRVGIYPLGRKRQKMTHPEAAEWVRRAHYQSLLSARVLEAQAHFLFRQPGAYARVGIDVVRQSWGSVSSFIGALRTFPKAVRFARDMQHEGISHIHAHCATHPALAAFVIHRLTGIPFSFAAHGSDLHVERTMLAAKVDAAAFAVSVSNFHKEIMVRTCGEHSRNKIHMVHSGVDPHCFVPATGPRNAGPFSIVCVASLEPIKGHTYLIEACRILRERTIDFRCDLLGDGPLRKAILRQISRAGLGDRIHLLGLRSRPDIVSVLSRADVAVLASHPTREGKREGIPVALMEAMASALPVVASAISGTPELVESGVTGILVSPGDAGAIATALERLAADAELRTRMGQAGRKRVLHHFHLETNTRQLLQLLAGTAPASPDVPANGRPVSGADAEPGQV